MDELILDYYTLMSHELVAVLAILINKVSWDGRVVCGFL